MTKEFTFGGKKVRITAYADRIVRVHAGEALAESLFDRYNLYAKPEADCGAEIENGISVDGLDVTFENGVVTFKTDRVTDNTILQTSEKYRSQVTAYASALQRIFCKPVKTAKLYFFSAHKFVDVI